MFVNVTIQKELDLHFLPTCVKHLILFMFLLQNPKNFFSSAGRMSHLHLYLLMSSDILTGSSSYTLHHHFIFYALWLKPALCCNTATYCIGVSTRWCWIIYNITLCAAFYTISLFNLSQLSSVALYFDAPSLKLWKWKYECQWVHWPHWLSLFD